MRNQIRCHRSNVRRVRFGVQLVGLDKKITGLDGKSLAGRILNITGSGLETNLPRSHRNVRIFQISIGVNHTSFRSSGASRVVVVGNRYIPRCCNQGKIVVSIESPIRYGDTVVISNPHGCILTTGWGDRIDGQSGSLAVVNGNISTCCGGLNRHIRDHRFQGIKSGITWIQQYVVVGISNEICCLCIQFDGSYVVCISIVVCNAVSRLQIDRPTGGPCIHIAHDDIRTCLDFNISSSIGRINPGNCSRSCRINLNGYSCVVCDSIIGNLGCLRIGAG